MASDDALRVSVLSEALPYIQRFAGRRIVVKYGGAAMVHAELREAVFRDLALLTSVGVQPVVVHGGGPEINTWLKRLDIPAEFRDGLRVTDPDTMDVVEMVLVGRVNKQIVNGLNKLGARAVGLSGSDGVLVEARPWGDGSHGLVGDVARVNPEVLEPLLEKGYVPVISSVAATRAGVAHNINADTVAGELAAALEAEKLILLTDTPGILRDRDNPESLIHQLRLSEARQLIEDGIVAGGMTPKTECCIRALAQGVAAAHILDGRVPHALLLEVFTDAGIGTMVMGRG
ncbi:acetylglutamate kinase [Synechococcus sp. UW105]|jgi:acetylglutamate kinase|uniref:acetylglutamate kinase n=1 Tax=unclassified Synechococcus TaxID=2626047 RepID=UPI000C91D7E0|nr:acetylglutamate kinase [Synechococcus sp. UW105]MAS28575.1 acetylglutamate kinase [Synechococcus sp. NAT40]RZO12139.1 MAG: acetylglutamate kinase [Synechococcus sp. MED-G135]|tara:strand:+ start:686 stop:1549 length:864 start_codon:yes stop_codon:yes gene_type:complete